MVKREYLSYFIIKLEDKDKTWAADNVVKLELSTFDNGLMLRENVWSLAHQLSGH